MIYFEKAVEFEGRTNIEWQNYIGTIYLEKKNYSLAKTHFDIALE